MAGLSLPELFLCLALGNLLMLAWLCLRVSGLVQRHPTSWFNLRDVVEGANGHLQGVDCFLAFCWMGFLSRASG
jgi:hypothetical protein